MLHFRISYFLIESLKFSNFKISTLVNFYEHKSNFSKRRENFLHVTECLFDVLVPHYFSLTPLSQDITVLWFNNRPYHTIPVLLNLYTNAFLKAQGQDVTVTVTNKPLPPSTIEKVTEHDQCRESRKLFELFC